MAKTDGIKSTETVDIDLKTVTLPNNPTFDTKGGKPNLREGETVIAEGKRDGLQRFVTNHGRVIFPCGREKYEAVYGPLKPAAIWDKLYPLKGKKEG